MGADEDIFNAITEEACESAGSSCVENVKQAQAELSDTECHTTLADTVHEACPRRAEHNPGGWNGFNMQFSQILVNLCEMQDTLKKDAEALKTIVRVQCGAVRTTAGVSEVLV